MPAVGPRVFYQHQLHKRRKPRRRRAARRPELSVSQILAWADEFQGRVGRWPLKKDGRIAGGIGDTWSAVNGALVAGLRGLPGGSSLPRLLAERRGVRNRMALPPLRIEQILNWADAFQRRAGRWPNYHGGPIPGSGGDTWCGINTALSVGYRGLPGGSSLAELLAQQRGVRNLSALPDLSVTQILEWADALHRRTGRWPSYHSGPIAGSGGETWAGVNRSLLVGGRGLPGDSSLAQLLAAHRGTRNKGDLPRLSYAQIVAWADGHFRRTGRWPRSSSGPVMDAPGETWTGVSLALTRGMRGLPGRKSLAQLLAERRGVRNKSSLRRLSHQQILAWADRHLASTGKWPHAHSGLIPDSGGETWNIVDIALTRGRRGWRGGSCLARFLKEKRGARVRKNLPRLSYSQILAWADTHFRCTGRWPQAHSGPIPDSGGESWNAVNAALAQGRRGLRGGSSLSRLLNRYRRKRSES